MTVTVGEDTDAVSASQLGNSGEPVYEDLDSVLDAQQAAPSTVLPSHRRKQSSLSQEVQDIVEAISPEVHKMYLTDAWEPVPLTKVPNALRWTLPQDSQLRDLNAFHLQLLLAYQASLTVCAQCTEL